MFSINQEAMGLLRELLKNPAPLGIEVLTLPCGTKLIDMGIKVPGSWEAGLYFVRINMGGLAHVSISPLTIGELDLTGVSVYCHQVMTATLASQLAGWALRDRGEVVIGTGPARALAALKDDPYMQMTPYRDKSKEAILCLQMAHLPSDKLALEVAAACAIKPEDTYLIVAPSASLVGSIQVGSRSIEQVVHRLYKGGFDLNRIIMAQGTAPIAPLIKDEVEAMGRINDALIYGSQVEFWVDGEEGGLEEICEEVLISSSKDCGKPFAQLFWKANGDFFQMDPLIHGVAKLTLHHVRSGHSFSKGRLYPEVLANSFSGPVLKKGGSCFGTNSRGS